MKAKGLLVHVFWCVFFLHSTLLVLCGHPVSSSLPQQPMISDCEGFSSEILSITFLISAVDIEADRTLAHSPQGAKYIIHVLYQKWVMSCFLKSFPSTNQFKLVILQCTYQGLKVKLFWVLLNEETDRTCLFSSPNMVFSFVCTGAYPTFIFHLGAIQCPTTDHVTYFINLTNGRTRLDFINKDLPSQC